MYRFIVMFPKSADPAQVDVLIEGIAGAFKARNSGLPVTRSAGALMGPGAYAGEAGAIFQADFPSIEDAMAALDADDFEDIKNATETLTSSIFLFEVQDA